MKYKDLKMYRVVFFLVFVAFPFLASASGPHAKEILHHGVSAPPPPPATLSYPGSPVCGNSPLVLNPATTSYTGGGTFYPSSNLLNINQQTGVITPSLSTPGTYTVSLLYNAAISQAVVVINPVPVMSITGSNSVCAGQNLSLFASGGFNYQWSTGATGSQITLSPTGNMTVAVSSTNNFGCTGTKSHVITYKPNPFVAIQSSSVCAGQTLALVAFASPSANATYTWMPGALNTPTIVIAPVQPQVYSVIVKVDGCTGNANQLVGVTPTVASNTSFSYITPLCSNSGDPFPIKSTGFSNGGLFFSDDPDIKLNATTGQVSLSGLPIGEHLVTYSIAARGCTLSSINYASLYINQGGNLVTNASEVTIEEGTSIELVVSGGSAYNWDPPDYLSCFDCDRPIASPLTTTRYCASDLVDGCILKACTDVIVVCVNNGDFSVPNAFTPNGDNNNERFCLQGWNYCVTDFKIMIYDRWGEKVFESTDPDFCWDGIFNGKLLNSGVYIYTIAASINRFPTSIKKGNITLIR